MSPFLGTGCGRSGTLWTSEFFSAIGFDTLHEVQFSPDRHGPLQQSEVSWLAVPYAAKYAARGVPILRVVRDPYASVISAMQLDFQWKRDETPFDKFLAWHRPDIVQPGEKLTRIIRYVASWDRPIDNVPHIVFHPDVDSSMQLQRAVSFATWTSVPLEIIDATCRSLGDKVNTKPRHQPELTRQDIASHPEGWKIRKRAERFGYA